jgi:tetratricopeptide (TPR) repeat protein
MLSDDYLVRKIMQFASVIARIFGLKMGGQYPAALEVIDQSLGQLLGNSGELANLLDDESLFRILTKNEAMDYEQLRFIADLFTEKGDILKLQKQYAESNLCYLRSLSYYVMMGNEASPQKEISPRIEELIVNLADWSIPEITLNNLFCYYENEGEYAKAEKILKRLAACSAAALDVQYETTTFYQRLLLKSPSELAAGGMDKKRIRVKLKRLLTSAAQSGATDGPD